MFILNLGEWVRILHVSNALPLSAWFFHPHNDWRGSKWVWLVTISLYKIYFLNMQRFFLSKIQHDWSLCNIVFLTFQKLKKSNIWFFGQLCYWQIHFLSKHTCTKNFTNHISITIILQIFQHDLQRGKNERKTKTGSTSCSFGQRRWWILPK